MEKNCVCFSGRMTALGLSFVVAAGLGLAAAPSSHAFAEEGTIDSVAAEALVDPEDPAAEVPAEEGTPTEDVAEPDVEAPEPIATETVHITVADKGTAASQLYSLIDNLRADYGAPALSRDAALEQAAWQRAAESTVLAQDIRPDGSDVATAASDYVLVGEVLTVERDGSADTAITQMTADPALLDRLVAADAVSVGVGAVTGTDGSTHWCVLLSATPAVMAPQADVADGTRTYSLALPVDNVAGPANRQDLTLTLNVGTTQLLFQTTTAVGELIVGEAVYPFDTVQQIGLDAGVSGAIVSASSHPDVASVDANGLVTAHAAGTTTVTASWDLVNAPQTWTVEVTDPNAAVPAVTSEDDPTAAASDPADQSGDTGQDVGASDQDSSEEAQPILDQPDDGAQDQVPTPLTESNAPVDLGECTITGATEASFDENGQLVGPFAVVLPDGVTTVLPEEYTGAYAYDAETQTATLTVTAVEGSTEVSGSAVYSNISVTNPPAGDTEGQSDDTEGTQDPQTTGDQADPADDSGEGEVQDGETDGEGDGQSADDEESGNSDSTPYSEDPASEDQSAINEGSDSSKGADDEQPVVEPVDISTMGVSVTASSNVPYTGQPVEPDVTVKLADGTELQRDVDYTLSYENNVEEGLATIKITGIGNYTGERTSNFNITKSATTKISLKDAGFAISPIADQVFTGSQLKPGIEIKGADGTILTEGQDFTVVSYENNVVVGVATVTAQATNSSAYSGTLTANFNVVPADLAGTSIVMPNQYANGQALTPVPVSVQFNGYALAQGLDYIVASYTDNVNVGTAYATLQGIGNFTGTINAKFAIIESANQTSESDAGTTATLPKTGDATNAALPIAIAAGGAALVAVGTGLVLVRRHKRDQQD